MERKSSAGFTSAGRSSLLFNEDDYDYAIELHPDDEYRQAAEALPDIVDFEDIELFSTEAPEEHENSAFPKSIADCVVNQAPFGGGDIESCPSPVKKMSTPQSPVRSHHTESNEYEYDTEVTALGTSPMNGASSGSASSKWNIISKGDFRFGLNMLEKHKKWVEKAARRSSIGFHKDHPSSDKEAMDKFLLTMARGVHVRRHQAGHISETVRLFSLTGCRTIQWEKPKAVELLAQRKQDGVKVNGSTDAVFTNNYDRSAFDCCIAVCGCGDDLVVGNGKHQEPQANMLNDGDNDYVGSGRWFHNIGFKRHGKFDERNIIAVHQGNKSDPTESGAIGTSGLRNSKDISNSELSFSIIIRDNSPKGYYTLDLECDTVLTYVLLLYGFKLLHEEQLNNPQPEQSVANTQIQKVVNFFDSAKSLVNKHRSLTKKTSDPMSHLFEPSSYIDPLRALRVGGGLLPEAHKSPTHAHSIRSSSPSVIDDQPKLPPARFLGWNAAGTQIWARLRMAGLEVKCVFSWDLERVILKIKCPTWRLEEMAEQMHLKLKSRDGYLKQFKVSRRDTFVPMGASGAIFRSSERQQIIDYIIRSKIKDGGAELDENTQLGKYIVQRFPLHMYSRLEDIRHSWVTFWKREKAGQVVASWSPFSESYGSTYTHIKQSTHYFMSNLLTQPLDNIAEYFGESIAFYFAYMAFYTRWLVFPSILGLIVTCFQLKDRKLDHWLCIPYGIIVTVWACFMLAFWRQKASALAYRWGVLDYEIEETERPQFKGDYMYDETSGEIRKSYSLWKRVGKYFVSIPVLLFSILLMLVIMTTIFTTQSHRADEYAHHQEAGYTPVFPVSSVQHLPRRLFSLNETETSTAWSRQITLEDLSTSSFWSVTFFYPSLYGVLVSMMTIIFDLLAMWLNDFENHRTQTTYMNRLILKVFSFQFVTVFTSLYYYAFFMRDKEGAFMRMSTTIFSLMTVGQWWSIFLDLCLPSIYHKALVFAMRTNYARTNRKIYRAREFNERSVKGNARSEAEEKLDKRHRYLLQAKSKCWEEALYAKYNNFSDYTTMVVQIGFVLCFSSVFPLAPLLALINNIALIRFNAMKICYTRQRPIAQKIGGIGVWEDVLQVMSVGGILTNCAIMGLTSTQLTGHLHSLGKFGIAVILFSYEQVLLFFKYWLHASIPRVPPSVQRAHHRERKSNTRKSILRNKLMNNGHGGGGRGDDKLKKFNNNKPIRNSSILFIDKSEGDNRSLSPLPYTRDDDQYESDKENEVNCIEQLDFNATEYAINNGEMQYDEEFEEKQSEGVVYFNSEGVEYGDFDEEDGDEKYNEDKEIKQQYIMMQQQQYYAAEELTPSKMKVNFAPDCGGRVSPVRDLSPPPYSEYEGSETEYETSNVNDTSDCYQHSEDVSDLSSEVIDEEEFNVQQLLLLQQQQQLRYSPQPMQGSPFTPLVAYVPVVMQQPSASPYYASVTSPPNPWDMTFDRDNNGSSDKQKRKAGAKPHKASRRGSVTGPSSPIATAPTGVQSSPKVNKSPSVNVKKQLQSSPEKKKTVPAVAPTVQSTQPIKNANSGNSWFWPMKSKQHNSHQLNIAPLQSVAKAKVTTAPPAENNAPIVINKSPEKKTHKKLLNQQTPLKQIELRKSSDGVKVQLSQPIRPSNASASNANIANSVVMSPPRIPNNSTRHLFPPPPVSPFKYAEESVSVGNVENQRHVANNASPSRSTATVGGVVSPSESPVRSAMAGSRKRSLQGNNNNNNNVNVSAGNSPNRVSVVKAAVDPLSRSHNPFNDLITPAPINTGGSHSPPRQHQQVAAPVMPSPAPRPTPQIVYSVQKKQQLQSQGAMPNPFSFAGKSKPERIQFD